MRVSFCVAKRPSGFHAWLSGVHFSPEHQSCWLIIILWLLFFLYISDPSTSYTWPAKAFPVHNPSSSVVKLLTAGSPLCARLFVPHHQSLSPHGLPDGEWSLWWWYSHQPDTRFFFLWAYVVLRPCLKVQKISYLSLSPIQASLVVLWESECAEFVVLLCWNTGQQRPSQVLAHSGCHRQTPIS